MADRFFKGFKKDISSAYSKITKDVGSVGKFAANTGKYYLDTQVKGLQIMGDTATSAISTAGSTINKTASSLSLPMILIGVAVLGVIVLNPGLVKRF